MTPELRQLRYSVAIAEEGSLTRAAARLHIAQQSLSQQVRTLEAQLGVTLFERSSRGVTLTDVGAVLLREARPVLARAERAAEAVRRAARGEQGELRVGFLSTVANYFMPPVVRAFRERHPGVTLHTEDLPIAALVAGVRDGTLDAGLSRPPRVDDLASEVVLREPVAAVLPEGHRLAGRAGLALADLADEPWVLTPRSSWPPWHRTFDQDFARAGYRPRVVQRGTTPQGLLALVAAGVGVTRLTLSSRSLRDGGVRAARRRGGLRRGARTLRTRSCRRCARSCTRSRGRSTSPSPAEPARRDRVHAGVGPLTRDGSVHGVRPRGRCAGGGDRVRQDDRRSGPPG